MVDASYLKLDNSNMRDYKFKYKLKKNRVRKTSQTAILQQQDSEHLEWTDNHVVESRCVNAFKGILDIHWQGL